MEWLTLHLNLVGLFEGLALLLLGGGIGYSLGRERGRNEVHGEQEAEAIRRMRLDEEAARVYRAAHPR